MTTWEKQKAYEKKRAEQLKNEMIDAIEKSDKERFSELYKTSLRYMKKSERHDLMMQFLAKNEEK